MDAALAVADVIGSLEEMRTAFNRAVAGAQRLLSIYTLDLEPEVYDQNAFLDIVKRFVLGHSFAKVRSCSATPRACCTTATLVAMGRRLTSYIEIRILHENCRSAPPRTWSRTTAPSHCARSRAPGKASPNSTTRRSRGSTCRNSTTSGSPASPNPYSAA